MHRLRWPFGVSKHKKNARQALFFAHFSPNHTVYNVHNVKLITLARMPFCIVIRKCFSNMFFGLRSKKGVGVWLKFGILGCYRLGC